MSGAFDFPPIVLQQEVMGMDFLHEFLSKVGNELGFDVKTEVEASESAFVDLVWFDRQLPLPKTKKPLHMRYAPVLPVVGFEIERHTGLNAKHGALSKSGR
jgi:hypothetical protein